MTVTNEHVNIEQVSAALCLLPLPNRAVERVGLARLSQHWPTAVSGTATYVTMLLES